MSRTAQTVVQVLSPSDEKILSISKDFFDLSNLPSDRCIVLHDAPFDNRTFKTQDAIEEYIKERTASHNSIWKVIFYIASNAPCIFERVTTSPQDPNRTFPSLYEAEFFFSGHSTSYPEQTREFRDLIDKHCQFDSSLMLAMPKSAQQALGKHFSNLSGLTSEITRKLGEAAIENENRLELHRQKLDQQADEHEAKRQVVHTERMAELAEREKKLEELHADLDLRRARDARRQLRDDITRNLKTRLKAPTNKLSTYVYRAGVVLISIVLCGFGIYFAHKALPELAEITDTTPIQQVLLAYLRFLVSTGAAAAFGFYAMSYLKKNAADDSNFERELERFALDIDRASWTIETVMEFKDEEDGQTVPEAWLQGATSNLFAYSSEPESDEESALDALGELLKKGAKLRIGNGEAELELGPSAAKKVGKS